MIQCGERCFSLLAFVRSGLFGPPLCGGLRPRNAPSPTTCLVDLVSLFVTGAQSKDLLPNHVPPVPEPVPPKQNCRTLSSLLSTLSSPLCLPSHPRLTNSTVRPGQAHALRLAIRRKTFSATAGIDSPPDCSHPKSGMHTFPFSRWIGRSMLSKYQKGEIRC